MNFQDRFLFHILRVDGIGNKTAMLLVDKLGGYSALSPTMKIPDCLHKYHNHIIAAVREAGIFKNMRFSDYVTCWSEQYPSLLHQTPEPPVILFYKGDITCISSPCFSIVGTRKASSYGKRWAYRLSYDLAQQGYTVVSGMAYGIDKEVHKGAIAAKGKTIAVLATEVEEPSPRNNADVYEKILSSDGLIFSEYSQLRKVVLQKGLFPSRNRIIAGLSMGTIVIEAAEKSGALITAHLAFDYNRDVFAVPGSIESPVSKGCNLLIKKGTAKLIDSVDDILIEFGHQLGFTHSPVEKQKNMTLTDTEKMIYDAVLVKASYPDELARAFSMNSHELISILTMLELKNVLHLNEDGRYVIS